MAEDNRPDPWKIILEQLNRIESNMLTRAEWTAHQQRFDGAISDMHRRIDDVQARSASQTSEWRAESMAEHKEFKTEFGNVHDAIKAVRDEKAKDDKDRQKESSTRRFTLLVSLVGAGLGLLNGFILFILNGGLG